MRLFVTIILFAFANLNVFSQEGKYNKRVTPSSKIIHISKPSLGYEILNCRMFETEAEYKTCDSGWAKYLLENVDTNIARKNAAPVGIYKVIVDFMVYKDGSIHEVFLVTNFGYGMEEELVRVIKQSTPWNPSTRNGRKMMTRRRQKFQFTVAAIPLT